MGLRRLSIMAGLAVVAGAAMWLARSDEPVPRSQPGVTPARAPPLVTAIADPNKATGEHEPAEATESAEEVPGAAVIDLDVLRADLPDNVYWTEAAPADDEPTRARRLADRVRRNALYGKVLSGTATADEIEGYFAERARMSQDYIAFVRRVLDRYGEDLTADEQGLYELAIAMHDKRLRELPRAKSDAYERQEQQIAARAAAGTR